MGGVGTVSTSVRKRPIGSRRASSVKGFDKIEALKVIQSNLNKKGA